MPYTEASKYAEFNLQQNEKVIGLYTPNRRQPRKDTCSYRWAENFPILLVLMKGEDSLGTRKAHKGVLEFDGEPQLIKGTNVVMRYGKSDKYEHQHPVHPYLQF